MFSLGLAGDSKAKAKLLDRENNNVTKLAVKSMTDMWDFSKDIEAMKINEQTEIKASKDQEEKAKQAALNKVQKGKKDPFEDKKVESDSDPEVDKLF